MTMTDKRTRPDPVKLNKQTFLRKNLHALKQLQESIAESRKRKSRNEYEFDGEGCDGQITPSTTKKHRIDNTENNVSEAEFEE